MDDESDLPTEPAVANGPADPQAAAGSTQFTPFIVPHRETQIQLLPTTPLLLFQSFIPVSMVERWVEYTNEAPGPVGPFQKKSRKNEWRPTSVAEVYLWLALMIYMGIHRETRYKDHWSTSPGKPVHPIVQVMTYDRFEQLLRRLRLCNAKNTKKSPYDRVDEWSRHVQQASTRYYNPGDTIAVDECMIRFTGRSKETVTIRTKPTPTGFKIWVVAQAGYFLRWLWATADTAAAATAAAARPRAGRREKPETRKRDIDNPPALTPTANVVVALLKLLPTQTYHVFMDNLFSSPDLFFILRHIGIAATGTARANCGLFERLIKAKKDDEKGICWAYNQLLAIPTPDGQVRDLTDSPPYIVQY